MSPKEVAVLEEMRSNIEEKILPDNTIKYSVKYLTYCPLQYTFPPEMSNFSDAQVQSENNFRKLLRSERGLEAIKEMMVRGERDNHFRILTEKEAETILAGPHCFSYQTTAFKDSSQST